MRRRLLTLVLLVPSWVSAQTSVLSPGATAEPRSPSNAIGVGAFAGAAELSNSGDWGRVRYAIGGADLRYERVSRHLRSGATVSSLVGVRTALDEPSFERFGWVADQFALTYVGGSLGFTSQYADVTGTLGAVVGATFAARREPVGHFGFSITARFGRLDRLAGYARLGSTDAWFSDRTLVGLGVVHDRARFRILVCVFVGATMAPALLASAADGPKVGPGFRETPWLIALPVKDFGARIEIGGRIRATYLGAEVSLGQQLPIGRIVVRTEFARPSRSGG